MDAPPKLKSGNWFSCNWRWFVPVAGVSVVVLGAAFAGVMFSVICRMITSQDVYQQAVAAVQASERAKEALGDPIRAKWWAVSGKIFKGGPGGRAELSIGFS